MNLFFKGSIANKFMLRNDCHCGGTKHGTATYEKIKFVINQNILMRYPEIIYLPFGTTTAKVWSRNSLDFSWINLESWNNKCRWNTFHKWNWKSKILDKTSWHNKDSECNKLSGTFTISVIHLRHWSTTCILLHNYGASGYRQYKINIHNNVL